MKYKFMCEENTNQKKLFDKSAVVTEESTNLVMINSKINRNE